MRKASIGWFLQHNLKVNRAAPPGGSALVGAAAALGVAAQLLSPAPAAADKSGSIGTSFITYDRQGDAIGASRHDASPPGGTSGAERDLRTRPPGSGAAAGANGFAGGVSAPPHEGGEILATGLDDRALRRIGTLGYAPLERATLNGLGITVWRLGIPASSSTLDALSAFRGALPGAVADYNGLVFTSAATHVNEGARVIGWREVSQSCGAGMRIGMIDSPVDIGHIALRGRKIEHLNFVSGKRRPAPPIHGTAIAALLVGDPAVDGLGGLVPGASLLAASIFEQREGIGTVGNLMGFLRALDWMAKRRVSVLNMSLETVQNRLMRKGLDIAHARGIVMTAAAGNGGWRAAPAYPAAHPKVIAVTAVSTRFRAFQQANRGSYIDFSAPGVHIWTAAPGGGGRYQSGTSLAVPFVTAVAALQLAAGVRPSPELIRGDLIPKVRDLGAPGKDDIYGWGLIRFEPKC